MFFCDGAGPLVVGPGTAGAPMRLHQTDAASNSCHCSVVQHQRHPQHHHNHHHSAFTMAAYQNHQDELAQLQELSNKWEPEATVLLSPPAAVSGQSTH